MQFLETRGLMPQGPAPTGVGVTGCAAGFTGQPGCPVSRMARGPHGSPCEMGPRGCGTPTEQVTTRSREGPVPPLTTRNTLQLHTRQGPRKVD